MNKTQTIERSAPALVLRILLLLFVLDTGYALLILLFLKIAPPSEYFPAFVVFLWGLHTIKYIAISSILLRTVLKWLGTTYVIEGLRLTTRSGVYGVNEKVYELEHLKELKVRQDWLGRMFHYGNITLDLSSSGFREAVELLDVHNPQKYEQLAKTR